MKISQDDIDAFVFDFDAVLTNNIIQIDQNSLKEKEIKTHMKKFLESDWVRFKKYSIRDSDICVRWVKKLIRTNYEIYDKDSS